MGRPITNHCLGFTCCIADAVIFVFNVSNYFRNGGGWIRENIEFFLSDLKKNLTFFSDAFKGSINEKLKTAS